MQAAWMMVLLLAPSEVPASVVGPGVCRLNPALEQARISIEGERPQAALADVHQAHMRRGNCRAQVVENYRLKAILESLLGDQERCRKIFEVLLAIEPSFQLPAVSTPTLKGCFQKATETPSARRQLALKLGRPTKAGDVVHLPLTLTDSLQVGERLRVYYRSKGTLPWISAEFEVSEASSVEVPRLAKAGPIELVVHLLDPWDGVLAELGSADNPLPIAVR